jgi:hypothetical protein
MLNRKLKKISKEIEAIFERLHEGKSAYSKGEFYNDEFYIRSDYALVVVNNNNEILVSFADHTRPNYAALYALLLGEIEDTNLFICRDYRTDEKGSMIIEEEDFASTGDVIWDNKKRYYNMLKQKVENIVIHKTK